VTAWHECARSLARCTSQAATRRSENLSSSEINKASTLGTGSKAAGYCVNRMAEQCSIIGFEAIESRMSIRLEVCMRNLEKRHVRRQYTHSQPF
jgi:hypothetical protein